jgi:hypothetical protein
MSIKPNLLCPPDYSILSLRFTECKKLGIVKGVSTLLSFDLSSFFIPLTNFSEKRLTIKAGATQKISIDDIASYWPLAEEYNFIYNDPGVANLTDHVFEIYDEAGALLDTISFTVDSTSPGYEDFPTAFETAFSASTVMKTLIAVEYGPALSEFTVTASARGVKYTYLMTYDASSPSAYDHPGTLLVKDLKYPEGRVRAIFLYADFAKASPGNCGCVDSSGELLSNVKNYKWVFDSEYQKKQTASKLTGVLVNADATDLSQQNPGGTQTFQWLTTGNSAAYHLEVGDMVVTNQATNNPYAFVTAIDGYNITVDRQGFGNGTGLDQLVKTYSPAPVQWNVGGEMLFLSGGQDVYDDNRLYIETIWINNPQNYDIPFTVIVVS